MRGSRLFDYTDRKSKKIKVYTFSDVPFFTENIGGEQKKKRSARTQTSCKTIDGRFLKKEKGSMLFVMRARPLIFSEFSDKVTVWTTSLQVYVLRS